MTTRPKKQISGFSPIEKLGLTKKLTNTLKKNGILTVSSLLNLEKKRMLKIRYIGIHSIKILQRIQKEYKSGTLTPKSILSVKQTKRLEKTYSLYRELGTLQATAKKIGVTRERVRQLLEMGQEHKLFKYTTTRKLKMKQLIKRVKKDQLVNEINKSPKIFDICSELNLKVKEYYKLTKHYQLDTQGYFKDARKRKYLIRYSKIVNHLGYHPSTTEMQSRRGWRYTSMAIVKIWGSTDRFRSEFGIVKPDLRMHPNTTRAWKKATLRRIKKKEIKKGRVLNLIKTQDIFDSKTISEVLNLSRQSVILYLNELVNEGILTKIGNIRNYKYIIKGG